MNIIYGEKRTGKTISLIKECAKHDGQLYCASLKMAKSIEANIIPFYQLPKIKKPKTHYELISKGHFGLNYGLLFIDDFEYTDINMLFNNLYCKFIHTVTMSTTLYNFIHQFLNNQFIESKNLDNQKEIEIWKKYYGE